MKLSARGLRIAAAAIGACGMVVAATMSGTLFASASATPAARKIVVTTCTGKADVKPSRYNIFCADGGGYLTNLHWVSWRASRLTFLYTGSRTYPKGVHLPLTVTVTLSPVDGN